MLIAPLIYATPLSPPREVSNGLEELLHHLVQFHGPVPRNVASCDHKLLPHPAAVCHTQSSHARPLQKEATQMEYTKKIFLMNSAAELL